MSRRLSRGSPSMNGRARRGSSWPTSASTRSCVRGDLACEHAPVLQRKQRVVVAVDDRCRNGDLPEPRAPPSWTLGVASRAATKNVRAHGVQSGVQIERNRAELRATEIALERRGAPGTPGSLRLGAGRSQVQILSPRFAETAAKRQFGGEPVSGPVFRRGDNLLQARRRRRAPALALELAREVTIASGRRERRAARPPADRRASSICTSTAGWRSIAARMASAEPGMSATTSGRAASGSSALRDRAAEVAIDDCAPVARRVRRGPIGRAPAGAPVWRAAGARDGVGRERP